MKNVKQANINIRIKDLFFKWLDITYAAHKLPKQKRDILALFLYHHYLLKGEITNNKILWKMVFDYDTKLKIKEDLDIDDQALQNTLTYYRKNNIIVNGIINPAFIPNIEVNSKQFKIIYNFNIVDG